MQFDVKKQVYKYKHCLSIKLQIYERCNDTCATR